MQFHEARYFYHSFPRRARNGDGEQSIGLKILSRIRHFGLLLTPEEIEWKNEHADGSKPRVEHTLQRRVCFTELAPNELPGHSQQFGRFALEFEVEVLRRWGAIPVFYLPRPNNSAGKSLEILGQALLVHVLDARNMANRVRALQQCSDKEGAREIHLTVQYPENPSLEKLFKIDAMGAKQVLAMLTHVITPPQMLYDGLQGILNYFYPVDDMRYGSPLAYYRQREWRLIGGVAYKGENVTLPLTAHDRAELLSLDQSFFVKKFRGGQSCLDLCAIFPGFDSVSVMQAVRRVIVPRESVPAAEALMSGLASRPPVIAIEDL